MTSSTADHISERLKICSNISCLACMVKSMHPRLSFVSVPAVLQYLIILSGHIVVQNEGISE